MIVNFRFAYFGKRLHNESVFCFYGAYVGAVPAACTIEGGYLHSETVACFSGSCFYFECGGKFRSVFYQNRADTCVRADERALVALYAGIFIPGRNFYGSTAFSNFVVPVGTYPEALKAETGRELPLRESMG